MKRPFAVIIILVLMAVPCFSQQEEKEPYVAEVDQDGVQRVEIVGGEYYYEPSHIVVKVDVPVEFKVRKTSWIVPHDIVMNEPEAGMDFKVNFDRDGEVIEFTPLKTGKFGFYCDKKLLFFKSHKEKGMEGVLEVVE